MIHPKTELRHVSDTVGYGVFATEFIPEGTIVYVKDSLEIDVSEEDYQRHSKPIQDIIEKYSYIDERGYRIISWDFAKYVNHSCSCNTISTGYGFEIAIRDIQIGEQITDEYGIFNLDYEMPCECGSPSCRRAIKPSDFETYHKLWDEKITRSLAKLKDVEQPLYSLIERNCKKELESYLNSRGRYRSIYNLRYRKAVTA
ncbi:MAG: SET domain-containing protein [Bacteroidia bacterium]